MRKKHRIKANIIKNIKFLRLQTKIFPENYVAVETASSQNLIENTVALFQEIANCVVCKKLFCHQRPIK